MTTEAVENTQEQSNPLSSMAVASISAYLASAEGQAVINKQLAQTVQYVIRVALGEHSQFADDLKQVVGKSFGLNGNLDLPSYNHTILELVKGFVEKARHDIVQHQVLERMTFLLEAPPKEILLSDLIEKYREFLRRSSEAGCVCDSSQNFYVRFPRSRDGIFFDVVLSEHEPSKHSSPDIAFGIGVLKERDGKKRGHIYTLRFAGEREVSDQMFVGPLYEFQKFLFQAKAGNTEVVIDITEDDEIDTYYGEGH